MYTETDNPDNHKSPKILTMSQTMSERKYRKSPSISAKRLEKKMVKI